MSDLVELLLDFVLDGLIEVIHIKRKATAVRIILSLALFSLVTGLLVLSYVNREQESLFYTLSLTGSFLGLLLLFILRQFAAEYRKKKS
ncbi:hypothetical protein SAMN04488102_1175 [Alkalibacterium subtropicum]|uniref:Uncharacterized protein n=1 Tax=Alkalibacterium subtropicum TaxID=753702 RepID=A0A1I1L1Z8_9LACT|nr:hypothetical protein [Alkalibacterium subtropicum]SFC66572.1 hypothetical protein SAMN04488102_1175 [Alkalibacterium subtropicum]